MLRLLAARGSHKVCKSNMETYLRKEWNMCVCSFIWTGTGGHSTHLSLLAKMICGWEKVQCTIRTTRFRLSLTSDHNLRISRSRKKLRVPIFYSEKNNNGSIHISLRKVVVSCCYFLSFAVKKQWNTQSLLLLRWSWAKTSFLVLAYINWRS